jgi:hypothetical protein
MFSATAHCCAVRFREKRGVIGSFEHMDELKNIFEIIGYTVWVSIGDWMMQKRG